MPIAIYGQKTVVIDGDKLHLRDSLGGEIILLNSIERGNQNQDALWITYDRRPGVDPWVKDLAYLGKNFTNRWNEHGIDILGVLITYDDCMCFKTKTVESPDMHLIHFKILSNDWTKMKELYPDMMSYTREIK